MMHALKYIFYLCIEKKKKIKKLILAYYVQKKEDTF